MSAREEKYIYDWETKRSKGKWSYLFLTAIVWGSLIPALITAFKLALKSQLSIRALADLIFDMHFLPTWIKFVAGFFLFALLMWQLAKRKYQDLKRRQIARGELQVHH